MIKTKEGTFYIVVNPFTHKCNISVNINSIKHEIDYWYDSVYEWDYIYIDNQKYKLNIYYDESFWIYIYEDGSNSMQEVKIEVQLYDNGPTIKLKNKQY